MSSDLLGDIARLLCVMIILCVAVGVCLTGMQTVESEAGQVEIMSSLTLFVTLVLFCIGAGGTNLRRYWFGAVVLAFLFAREFDLDKMIFRDGVLSIKHYSGAAPLWQKGVGAVIFLGLLIALVLLARRGVPRLIAGLKAGKGWAALILLALGLLVFGKSLDGAGRKLADFGVMLPYASAQIALLFEEVAELAAALCLMLAVVRLPVTAGTTDHARWERHHEI